MASGTPSSCSRSESRKSPDAVQAISTLTAIATAGSSHCQPVSMIDWGKPKGMYWRTYERLCREHDTLSDRALVGIMDHLNRLTGRF